MIPGIQVGIPNLKELVGSLVRGSALLEDEAKAALLHEISQATDPDELSRIAAFLKDEKRFIVAYLRYLLKEDRIPEKIPELMGDLKRDYLERMRIMEAASTHDEPFDILQTFETL